MTRQAKATHLSLLLHAALAFAVLLFSRDAVPEAPPLVIDFSIAAAEAATGEPAASSATEPQKTQASAPPTPAEPVVLNKETPKTRVNTPQKMQKKSVPSSNRNKEKRKKDAHVQPAADQAVAEEQQAEASEALAADASQAGQANGPGAATTAGRAASQGQKAAENGQQGGSGKEGGTGRGGSGRYNFDYVRELILHNLSFPATARAMGLTGKIIVSFVLKEDGYVEEIAIVSGSGHEILDRNVVATIRRIAPFPKPPARAQLVLPIVYNLKQT